MTPRPATAAGADATADLIVIGGGLIGLAVATQAADRGLSVALLTDERPGAASRAAAGLLVPHHEGEDADTETQRFMAAGRDAYPAYVQWVEERSGDSVPLLSAGAVQVARSEEERDRLWLAAPPESERLTGEALTELEPALAPAAGGVLHPRDGAVDNVRLTDALAAIVARDRRVRIVRESAVEVSFRRGPAMVVGSAGLRVTGSRVVLAAGAWAAGIEGLPRPIPVRPLRGQICAVRSAPLRHVVLDGEVYLVSRGGDRTLVGSTMEDVGFDVGTTAAAIDALRRSAAAACPALATQALVESWSGLRPATPDLLPILGPDPDEPRLLYACGHSRNGILLAPVTAAVTCALALGERPEWDLTPFSIRRFAEAARA